MLVAGAAVGQTALYLLIAMVGGVLALGIILGQFRRGVVAELRASLGTAQVEIGIHKDIVERLQGALDKLEKRLAALEEENRQLHATLEVGTALIPFVRDEFSAFEARVVARHRMLAAALPPELRDALSETLSDQPTPGGTP